MYEIFRTTSFKKDYKKLSNKEKILLKSVVTILAKGEKLDDELKDHNQSFFREINVQDNKT